MNKLFRLLRYDLPLHFVVLLTNWLPDNVPFLRLRGFLAHFFLGSCGRDLRLGRNISFYNPSKIHFGEHIYVAYGCWFMAGEEIRVEDEVIFGPYCVIVSSNHGFTGNSFRYGQPLLAPIRVERGSWIGGHVTLTAGAEIGAGCLVAANTVVPNQKFPGRSLIGGVPARIVKSLDSHDEH